MLSYQTHTHTNQFTSFTFVLNRFPRYISKEVNKILIYSNFQWTAEKSWERWWGGPNWALKQNGCKNKQDYQITANIVRLALSVLTAVVLKNLGDISGMRYF